MSNIIPLFTSDYSIGRSILPINKAGEIVENAPVSIVSIAQKYKIDPCYIIDDNLTGFIKTYKYFEEIKQQFIFGLKIIVVQDINKKDQDSLDHECKVVVFMKNSEGYSDLIRIFSHAATDGKYYVPRTSWSDLKRLWSKNLILAVPFFDSFLHVNLLTNGKCIPDFPDDPIFFKEKHNLPFNFLIEEAVDKYCEQYKFKTQNVHSIYYFKNEDITAYTCFRAIGTRGSFNLPGLNHFGSNDFSFESYLSRIGKTT